MNIFQYTAYFFYLSLSLSLEEEEKHMRLIKCKTQAHTKNGTLTNRIA